MLDVVARTLHDCLEAKEVPLANIEQCGWASNHTLEGAQKIVRNVLGHKDKWQKVFG
jgi:S-ribosylhomocysteine lyase